MKKFLALLISVAMVVALVAIPAAAEGEVAFTVATVNDVTPGTDVMVPVTLEGDYEAHIITIELHYDPENLSIEKKADIQSGDLIPADAADLGWLIVKDISNPGVAKLGIIISEDPMTGNGTLCNVKFHVNENCTENQPIELVVKEFKYMPLGETIGTDIPYVGTNGAINLAEVTPTEPPVDPTDPPVDPTDPPVDPTEPPVTEGAVFTMESKDGVEPGSQITLDFTVEGDYAAHTFYGSLEYDTNVLEVVDVTMGDAIPDDAFSVIDFETVPGSIRLGFVMPSDPMEGEGTIVSVTFNVSEDFDAPTVIEVIINEFNYVPEEEAIEVDYESTDGVVTPAEVIPAEPVVFTMGGQENVPGGATITLPFSIAGEYEAHTMNICLNYDPEVLTIVGVENGPVLTGAEGAVIIVDYETVPGSVRIGVVMPDEPMTAEGVIANLTFKVCDDFDAPTVIEVVVNEFGYMPVGASNQQPIEYVAHNGIVTPKEGTTPTPPPTGTASLVGLGVIAMAAGAGIVIFRKKED